MESVAPLTSSIEPVSSSPQFQSSRRNKRSQSDSDPITGASWIKQLYLLTETTALPNATFAAALFLVYFPRVQVLGWSLLQEVRTRSHFIFISLNYSRGSFQRSLYFILGLYMWDLLLTCDLDMEVLTGSRPF